MILGIVAIVLGAIGIVECGVCAFFVYKHHKKIDTLQENVANIGTIALEVDAEIKKAKELVVQSNKRIANRPLRGVN